MTKVNPRKIMQSALFRGKASMVGWKYVSQKYQVLISRSREYTDMEEDVIKLKTLSWGDYFGWSWWALHVITGVIIGGAGGVLTEPERKEKRQRVDGTRRGALTTTEKTVGRRGKKNQRDCGYTTGCEDGEGALGQGIQEMQLRAWEKARKWTLS